MMSSAVKGKTVSEVRDLTRAFKAMMSIHESSLDRADGVPDGDDDDDGDGDGDGDEQLAPAVKLGDLEALRGVVKFPVRIKCATLAWNTLAQGLDEVEA
jgi:nitrogen fixation NifU-like protein